MCTPHRHFLGKEHVILAATFKIYGAQYTKNCVQYSTYKMSVVLHEEIFLISKWMSKIEKYSIHKRENVLEKLI